MPKERSINPAQAQRKAEKSKAIRKGKAEQAARRNEKLAQRNPERLQKQLDELKALETSGGKLTSHEQTLRDELERDIKAIRKARDSLGDKAPPLRSGYGGDSRRDGDAGVLGKRRRPGWGAKDGESDESDVPEDVRSIPMPRDTPPPIPREVLDKWYKARRERQGGGGGENRSHGTSANNMPLGGTNRGTFGASGGNGGASTSPVPPVEAKTVYEAAPVVRDLRKEAVSAFIPSAVRAKLDKTKGIGGLVEPEEADRLEKEGYLSKSAQGGAQTEAATDQTPRHPKAAAVEEVQDEDD